MLVNKPKQGFGMRSWRYSALIDNCEIVKMFIKEGKNDDSSDNDPFAVSDANTMLSCLQEKSRKWYDGYFPTTNHEECWFTSILFSS